jgi:MoaA/NifB/PqqE/SkfB family radical SAM enzyme
MPLDDDRIYPFGTSRDDIIAAADGDYARGFYRRHPCYAPFLHMFIAWDGKVYLCCMTNGRIPPLGDLSCQSAAEVFRGQPFQALRARMMRDRLPACHGCDMVQRENRRLHEALHRPLQLLP